MAGKENSNEGKQAGDQQIENLESMISIKSEDIIKKSSLNAFETKTHLLIEIYVPTCN